MYIGIWSPLRIVWYAPNSSSKFAIKNEFLSNEDGNNDSDIIKLHQ